MQAILDRIEKTSSCWLWVGNIDPSSGYGRYGQQKAHRVVYTKLAGQIPEGLDLDHLCRNRRCVNPDHLEPVTRKVNVLRGEGMYAVNAKKTHCPQGHAYDYAYPNGYRRCRTCLTDQGRKWRAKKAMIGGV